MARRRKAAEEMPVDPDTVIDDDLGSDEPKPRRQRKRRLAVYATEDGGIDASALAPEERKTLQVALAEEKPAAIDSMVMGVLISALGSLEATFLASRFEVPRERALQIVGPHEPLKSGIAEAATRVANKYHALDRWADEIALVSLLAVWQIGVMEAFRAETSDRRGNSYNSVRNNRVDGSATKSSESAWSVAEDRETR